MLQSRHVIPFALILVSLLAACVPEPEDPAGEGDVAGTPAGLANGSFFVRLNGFDIHYEVHGRGPVLMTVPNSWGLTYQGLRTLYRPLEEHLTLVYFDPRGMGTSGPIREDADMGMAAVRADFDALRLHLELEKVHAIGWSNGATNLIFLASECPEILSSAIFLHGTARHTEEDDEAFGAQYPDLVQRFHAFQEDLQDPEAPGREKDARTKQFFLEEWMPHLWADPGLGRTRLAEMYRETGFSWRHLQFTNLELPTFDARDRLAAIPVPSLVIAGAHDMLPFERVEEIHTGLPEATFVLFENSGHFAPVEEPDGFATAVLDFLATMGGEDF